MMGTELVEIELTSLEEHRAQMFEEMKFTKSEAKKLAKERSEYISGGYAADVHRVRKMLDQGCSHKKILNIFL